MPIWLRTSSYYLFWNGVSQREKIKLGDPMVHFGEPIGMPAFYQFPPAVLLYISIDSLGIHFWKKRKNILLKQIHLSLQLALIFKRVKMWMLTKEFAKRPHTHILFTHLFLPFHSFFLIIHPCTPYSPHSTEIMLQRGNQGDAMQWRVRGLLIPLPCPSTSSFPPTESSTLTGTIISFFLVPENVSPS